MIESPHKLVCLSDYEDLVGAETVERILTKAEDLADMHVCHVNSTYCGGVAELLSSLSILMNSAGVKTGWRAIQGASDYFSITKKMHNALQGGDINLTERKKEVYEDVVRQNAYRNHLQDHDAVIVHDPQPLPMVTHYRKRGPWIWRCHLDLSSPHRALWEYLQGFVERYDAMVVSSRKYATDARIPQLTFMPAIDPFSIKNKELSEADMDDRLAHYGIPTDLPLVVQISRFDKWKDPEGVIEAFRIAQQEVDATLVLLGNFAADDPEGREVYESLLDCRDERVVILSVQDTALVNTLQRRAAVVVQKSLREGFGLTVTEAMWKGAAVVAGNVGGIPLQVEDGVNGFLVDDVRQCAERVVALVRDEKLRREVGERARRTVRERFLLTRLLENWLDLLGAFRSSYRLTGMRGHRVDGPDSANG